MTPVVLASWRIAYVLVAIVLVIMPTSTLAQAVVSDDAQVSTAPKSLGTNFGGNPNLTVSSTGPVYLKFKLSSVVPAGTPGASVESATLQLYLANVGAPGVLDVYAIVDVWNEATITGANAPQPQGFVASSGHVSLDQRGQFLLIDVTDLVRQWLGSDGSGAGGLVNQGLMIAARPESAVPIVTFDSKENSQTSHEPFLHIVLSDGQGGTGSVTSVSVTEPLTVSNPTTTPSISLGVVPALNGGTGLAGSGPVGSFLRSTGTGWTSGAIETTDVPAGSGFYIHNSPNLQIQTASFAISGPALVQGAFGIGGIFSAQHVNSPTIFASTRVLSNVFDSTGAFRFNGAHILSAPGFRNLFAGASAGAANDPQNGNHNTFIGAEAGQSNTTGDFNTFVGARAGLLSQTGESNTAIGSFSGDALTDGSFNSFLGSSAGSSVTTGSLNTFLGGASGQLVTTGSNNTYIGFRTGRQNLEGSGNTFIGSDLGSPLEGDDNTFVGFRAGGNNQPGVNNVALGARAVVLTADIENATALGARAEVSQSNSLVLGSVAGFNLATETVKVGIGITTPKERLDVRDGNILVGSAGNGMILKSPNGAVCRLVGIDNTGSLTVTAVACP